MKKKSLLIVLALFTIMMVTACGADDQQESSSAAETPEATAESAEQSVEEDARIMKITIDGEEYDVQLDDNVTVDDIISNMPLTLEVGRYAGHEFYSDLPFTPTEADEVTSQFAAGHVYYWAGGNAFSINYAEYDISPYQAVHIGEITDKSICDYLINANDTVTIHVTE